MDSRKKTAGSNTAGMSRKTLMGLFYGSSIALFAVWMYTGYTSWFPNVGPSSLRFEGRLQYVLQLCVAPSLVCFMLFLTMQRVADSNKKTSNPLSGESSTVFKINQKVLTNTIEQAAVFVPLLISLALQVDRAEFRVVPFAMLTWVVGRVLFWLGYHIPDEDRLYRGLGGIFSFWISPVVMFWLARYDPLVTWGLAAAMAGGFGFSFVAGLLQTQEKQE